MKIATATLLAVSGLAQAQISVRMLQQPPGHAYVADINERGEVVARLEVPHEALHHGLVVARWSVDGHLSMLDLGLDLGVPDDISNDGVVTLRGRNAGEDPAPYLWFPDGTLHEIDVYPAGRMISLRGGAMAAGFPVAEGLLVPGVRRADGSLDLLSPDLWPSDWGAAVSLDAASSHVAGYAAKSDGFDLFSWTPGEPPVVIAVPDGFAAEFGAAEINVATNDLGWVAGAASAPGNGTLTLYVPGGGVSHIAAPGVGSFVVLDLNNRGMALVLGWESFGWRVGVWTERFGFVRIEDLMPAGPSDMWIAPLPSMNDAGQIATSVTVISHDGSDMRQGVPVILTLCPADFNLDATADVHDLLDYLAAFREGDQYANFDRPADSPLDVRDLLAFLQAFREGC